MFLAHPGARPALISASKVNVAGTPLETVGRTWMENTSATWGDDHKSPDPMRWGWESKPCSFVTPAHSSAWLALGRPFRDAPFSLREVRRVWVQCFLEDWSHFLWDLLILGQPISPLESFPQGTNYTLIWIACHSPIHSFIHFNHPSTYPPIHYLLWIYHVPDTGLGTWNLTDSVIMEIWWEPPNPP